MTQKTSAFPLCFSRKSQEACRISIPVSAANNAGQDEWISGRQSLIAGSFSLKMGRTVFSYSQSRLADAPIPESEHT
jgi:hypothetical protein